MDTCHKGIFEQRAVMYVGDSLDLDRGTQRGTVTTRTLNYRQREEKSGMLYRRFTRADVFSCASFRSQFSVRSRFYWFQFQFVRYRQALRSGWSTL